MIILEAYYKEPSIAYNKEDSIAHLIKHPATDKT